MAAQFRLLHRGVRDLGQETDTVTVAAPHRGGGGRGGGVQDRLATLKEDSTEENVYK